MRPIRDMNPFVRGLLIVAVIAAIVVILQLQQTLFVLGLLMRILFILALVYFAYLFWRDHRHEIDAWPQRAKAVFYGAAALAVVDLLVSFLFGISGPDALAFFLVLGACAWAMWRVWREQRTYS